MSIRQLNASYVPQEDRVMLRFTTLGQEEYRLWLTRSVVGLMLGQLAQVAVKVLEHSGQVHQARAVAEIRQQALQDNAQYTRFEPAIRLPLGAEPVLVRAVQVQSGQGHFSLQLDLVRNKTLTLRLSEELVGKLRLLLQRMDATALWCLAGMTALPPAKSELGSDAEGDSQPVTANPAHKLLH